MKSNHFENTTKKKQSKLNPASCAFSVSPAASAKPKPSLTISLLGIQILFYSIFVKSQNYLVYILKNTKVFIQPVF